MDKLLFAFKLEAAADGKSNIIAINSIGTQNDRKFRLTAENSPASKHKLLTATPNFTKVRNSLKKRHQTRNVWITLNAEMKEEYFDADGNLQFDEEYLEEIYTIDDTPSIIQNDTMTSLLEKLIENTKKSEEKSVASITKEFIIDKFNNKTTNANQWINEFEKECERFEVIQDRKRIEALKIFLDKPFLDWYSCMMLKLSVNSEWKEWKKIFCETFANKGWSPIRYAFTYRYQKGNLVDYAIKKERLLLEVRRSIDTGTLIDLIAIGLPNFVADKIDREIVETTEELCNELGKLEHLVGKKIENTKTNKNEAQKKMPCGICKTNGKGTRFHQEDKCWFKEEQKLENTSLLDIDGFQETKN